MILGVFISNEKAETIKGTSFGSGFFNPIQDDDGRFFVSEIEGKHIEGAGSPEMLYRYTSEAKLARMFLFIQLKTTFNQDAFFEENKELFDYWLANGGGAILDLFETSTDEWLDVASDEGTPRKYALSLLK
tara:strand:+ start:515 stop:907 length:393 start_codon:yes stop_codon:yes gene_type:complete